MHSATRNAIPASTSFATSDGFEWVTYIDTNERANNRNSINSNRRCFRLNFETIGPAFMFFPFYTIKRAKLRFFVEIAKCRKEKLSIGHQHIYYI